MSRQIVIHFDTVLEANAFEKGVEWVNDSSIEHQGYSNKGRSLLYTDEDGTNDTVIDYRKSKGE